VITGVSHVDKPVASLRRRLNGPAVTRCSLPTGARW